LKPGRSHGDRLVDPRLDVPARRITTVREKGVDTSNRLLRILGIPLIGSLAIFFRNRQDPQSRDRFDWVGRFRVEHSDANIEIVADKKNSKSRDGTNQTAFEQRTRRDHVNFGGADGIVSQPLKKTEEKPLNSRVYCYLLIFPMSLRNPLGFFGHPYNAPFWQQLATVRGGSV